MGEGNNMLGEREREDNQGETEQRQSKGEAEKQREKGRGREAGTESESTQVGFTISVSLRPGLKSRVSTTILENRSQLACLN